MNNLFTLDVRLARRVAYLLMATLLFAAGLPFVYSGKAWAASQLQSRSIQLSDSGASGGSITTGEGSGTNVTYRVSFTTATTAASMVIDFCSEDPIIGDTCTAPTGMNASGATIADVTSGGNVTNAGWTVTASASQVKLAQGTGSAMTAGAQQFDLTGITNPSTVGTYYARIYTFALSGYTDGTTAYSSATNPGGYNNYGGIALSTTAVITITARVQEQLTFCVSKDDPTNWTTTLDDCSDTNVATNPPNLTLGQSSGSGEAVLDASRVDTGDVYSNLSTNATDGAVIDMVNSNTLCGGLSADNGATCAIPAVGSTNQAITAGTAAFGMHMESETVSADTKQVGSITPSATYYTSGHTFAIPPVWYGMDNQTAASNDGTVKGNVGNVETTFGSIVGTTSSPVHHADNEYQFAATPSLTTPAGIYTANLSLIATGTF